jgi:hypothetical protein
MESCDDELKKFEADGAEPVAGDKLNRLRRTRRNSHLVQHLRVRLACNPAAWRPRPQRQWGYLVPALVGSGYRVILIDSRSHGAD